MTCHKSNDHDPRLPDTHAAHNHGLAGGRKKAKRFAFRFSDGGGVRVMCGM